MPTGLLQPHPIHSQPWLHTTINFEEELLRSQVFDSVWVLLDCLTMYAYFTPLIHPFIAKIVAQLFVK